MKDKLSAFERRLEMLFLLNKCRETTALELSYYFAVSKDTIFRDIDFLNRYAPIYTKNGIAGGVFLYEEYRNGLFLYLTVEEERFLEELAQMLEPDKKLRMQSIINRFSMPKIRT